jgi:hypothetical protein
MVRFLPSLLLLVVLLAAGCATNSPYGVEADPAVQAVEGKETTEELEEDITRENQRALRDDESMFRSDDSY